MDAVLTGVHEPGTSHHALLRAFLPAPLLDRAVAIAGDRGFLGHEFGDVMLVLGKRVVTSAVSSRTATVPTDVS